MLHARVRNLLLLAALVFARHLGEDQAAKLGIRVNLQIFWVVPLGVV
jgi:ABC-type Fe3+-siderophore transport system permease subunit